MKKQSNKMNIDYILRIIYNNFMKRFIFGVIFFTLLIFNVKSDDIIFPPELMWWIYEIKKINANVEVNKFTLFEHTTQRFTVYSIDTSKFLTYPVFMRWNY